MAKLSSISQAARPQKVLVFGGPKSGKTLLVGQLAEHGYNLHWFDGENGADTLFQLSPEAQDRITLYSVTDLKDSPEFAKSGAEYAGGKAFTICEAHGKVKCVKCKSQSKPMDEFNPDELGENDIVVWDSITQMVTSVQNHVARNDSFDDFGKVNKESKREWGHYMGQNLILNAFYTYVQNSRHKVVCISHETDLDADSNPNAKLCIPTGGTSTQSKSLAKYFGHVVHCRLRANNHSQISGTTSDNSTVAGSRLNITISKEPTGLASLFAGKKVIADNVVSSEEVSDVKSVEKAVEKVAVTQTLGKSMSAMEKLKAAREKKV